MQIDVSQIDVSVNRAAAAGGLPWGSHQHGH
jgi:hypothetical protein